MIRSTNVIGVYGYQLLKPESLATISFEPEPEKLLGIGQYGCEIVKHEKILGIEPLDVSSAAGFVIVERTEWRRPLLLAVLFLAALLTPANFHLVGLLSGYE